MSSEKIPTTVRLPKDILQKIVEEKTNRKRSISFIVEESLRDRYKLEGERVAENAKR